MLKRNACDCAQCRARNDADFEYLIRANIAPDDERTMEARAAADGAYGYLSARRRAAKAALLGGASW